LIKGIVALYTPDSRYAGAFLDYNLRKEREKVTVKIFTNDESLWGAANKESFDLLLIDGMCMDEKMEELPGKKAILSRKKFIAKREYPAVFMYQKAMLVFKQIYEILAEETVEERFCCAAVSAMPRIYGVFSPCYPVLRERFARCLAGYLGEHKKVLYLNMAKFAEGDSGDEKGLSELMYFIQQEDKSMVYKLSSMVVEEDGYDSLPGVRHYKDISDISEEDIIKLMRQFELVDEYDAVVIDNGLENETAYCLLDYCNEIWMPVDENVGYARYIHMKNDVKKERANDLWEHIKEINKPITWYERKDMTDIWMKEHVDISS